MPVKGRPPFRSVLRKLRKLKSFGTKLCGTWKSFETGSLVNCPTFSHCTSGHVFAFFPILVHCNNILIGFCRRVGRRGVNERGGADGEERGVRWGDGQGGERVTSFLNHIIRLHHQENKAGVL